MEKARNRIPSLPIASVSTVVDKLSDHVQNADNSDCGITDPIQAPRETVSFVSFPNNMGTAQSALQIPITDARSETRALNGTALLQAIGRGVGNFAAHEIAHHFLGDCCHMDISPDDDPEARATYNAGRCSAAADPSPWKGFWPNPKIYLHWEAPALRPLNKCLNLGFREFSLTNPCTLD